MAEEYVKNIKENVEGLRKLLEEKGMTSAANHLREKSPDYDGYIELLNSEWESNELLDRLVKDRTLYEVGVEVFDELCGKRFPPLQARRIAEKSVYRELRKRSVGGFIEPKATALPQTLVGQLFAGGFLRRKKVLPGKKGRHIYEFVEDAGKYLKALSEIPEQELKEMVTRRSSLRQMRTEMEYLPKDDDIYKSLQEMSLALEKTLEQEVLSLIGKE